ncbi:MAG TPA: outer membrane lipoprotein carrier protein LolA [bacterium]|nr:outer membrane lipoprotein carrier protein LolA [bacterium]
MRMRCFRILFFVLIVFIPLEKMLSAKNDEKTTVRRVKKTLEKLETLHCLFERSYYIKVTDRTTEISGRIYLKKPYMLRVEYPAQTIVVDGEAVWVYVPGNKQVRISEFIHDKESFPTPLNIFEKYSNDRKIEFAGIEEINGKVCDILELISSNPEEMSVKVWVDRKLDFPVKTVEESSSGDTIQFVLKDIVLNGTIEDEIFTFVIPEGVETIDLRE